MGFDITLKKRSDSERKAYCEGYVACYKDFCKDLETTSVESTLESMKIFINILYLTELKDELKGENKLTCDRNICLQNEYNNIGCEDCVVTKGENK